MPIINYYNDPIIEILHMNSAQHRRTIHCHPQKYQIILVLSGYLTFEKINKSFILGSNDIQIIHPLCVHAESCANFVESLLISIDKTAIATNSLLVLQRIDDAINILYCMGIVNEIQVEKIVCAAYKSVTEIYRHIQVKSEHLENSLKLLENNYSSKITVSQLADCAGTCEVHFHRLFKKAIGITPHQLLLQHRINKAEWKLIRSGESVAEIASSCGFYDKSHFVKHFKQQYGSSPHAYRKSLKSANKLLL